MPSEAETVAETETGRPAPPGRRPPAGRRRRCGRRGRCGRRLNLTFIMTCNTDETTTTTAYDKFWFQLISATNQLLWYVELSNLNCYPNIGAGWWQYDYYIPMSASSWA